jgi:phosphoesterase RecJ-like protein
VEKDAFMPLDWSPFVKLVDTHQHFLLTAHIRPDGDALGSLLALADALQQRGKTVQATIASSIPPRYAFLDPEHRVVPFRLPGDEYRSAQVVVVLDTGTWNQLGDFGTLLRAHSGPRVVVDHHLTQDDLGALRFVDTEAEATGRLIHDALTALGTKLSPATAERLFVALAMDTGWYRHQNTTAPTLDLAAQLVAAGANPTRIYELLFEQNSLSRLRLTGLILSRMQVLHDGRIAITEVHRGDYEATGAVPHDSEDLVNYTRSIAGIEVGIFLLEQPRGGVKISFRSRETVDVAILAEQFGGGGHRLAAGAIVVDQPLEQVRGRVLAAVQAAIDASFP